jgi:uncharacterized membrane protein
MVPFLVLLAGWMLFRALGVLGLQPLDGWQASLRAALALMFVVTASAHFGSRRRDLVAMVPPVLPAAGRLVTLTGVLELAGAAGLLYAPLAPLAAAGLAMLLVLMFPANMRAARARLRIGGRPATPLGWRVLLQALFLAALVGAAL